MTNRHRLPATRAMDRIAGSLGNSPEELWFKSLLAHSASGREVYDRLPYFFSDQYDLGVEYGSSSPSGTGTAW